MNLLIDKAADIDSLDDDKKTLARYAAKLNSNMQVLKLLVDKGADIQCLNDEMKTPADYAYKSFRF